MSTLKERYERVEQRVRDACDRAGRSRDEVLLIAVSKTVGPEVIAEGIACGMRTFGENRPEMLAQKAEMFPDVSWHMIGNIQRRRIKDIIGHADLIHSVDRTDIFPVLDRVAQEHGIVQDVLLECNISGEQTKSGFPADKVEGALLEVAGYPHLQVRGLMTMAPEGEPDMIVKTFSGLRELEERLAREDFGPSVELRELSMGMSEDFECAIEQGATIIRVGRCIFSEDFADACGTIH